MSLGSNLILYSYLCLSLSSGLFLLGLLLLNLYKHFSSPLYAPPSHLPSFDHPTIGEKYKLWTDTIDTCLESSISYVVSATFYS